MRSRRFALLCLIWLADMALLAAIGPLGRFVGASMALYGGGFVLLVMMVRFFPAHMKAAHALGLIAALGFIARSAFLFFPPNTDIYRYIWEGAIQNHGFNPYILSPDDPALAFLAQGELSGLWQDINHKWLSAIYPPAAMLFFRLLAGISPNPLFFKAVFLLFDMGVVAILAALLRMRRLPACMLLLYSANPLVIVFISGEGHLDVLQVFFLCLCLFLVLNRSIAGGYLSLGLAMMSKYLSAAVAPLCFQRRAGWKALALLLPFALFIPYLSAGSGLFRTLGEFATRMHYNDGVTEVAGALFGSWSLQAAAVFFFLGLVWVWLAEDDLLRSVYLVIGCLLLVLPTLHPWYLVMIAPFLCFFPSRAWLYLQASMLFTFPVLGHEFRAGVFQEIGWLKLIEYLPFFGLLAWGLIRNGRLADPRTYRAPESISVIIPVLNEAEHIGRLLADLQNRPWVQETIVSDGGSADDTIAVAKAFGARVVSGEKGRGLQIRSAAEAARGDVLLILHADARLQPEATARIIAALSADRGAAGGFFGMQFADANMAQRAIAILNNVKAIATGVSFGDQAQFVRAEALWRMGGFPGIMLMEDVELSLRLKALGGAIYLGPGVTVSGRRWQAGKFTRNIWTVGALFFRYLLERRLERKADDKWYYRKYYRDLA